MSVCFCFVETEAKHDISDNIQALDPGLLKSIQLRVDFIIILIFIHVIQLNTFKYCWVICIYVLAVLLSPRPSHLNMGVRERLIYQGTNRGDKQ